MSLIVRVFELNSITRVEIHFISDHQGIFEETCQPRSLGEKLRGVRSTKGLEMMYENEKRIYLANGAVFMPLGGFASRPDSNHTGAAHVCRRIKDQAFTAHGSSEKVTCNS